MPKGQSSCLFYRVIPESQDLEIAFKVCFITFSPIPCRVASSNDKEKVECNIKFLKGNFFNGKVFSGSIYLDNQLRAWNRDKIERIRGTVTWLKRLPPGEMRRNPNIILVKSTLKSGKVKLWSLVTTKDYSDPCKAVRDYRLRWQIEERYKQLKDSWLDRRFNLSKF